MIRVEDLPQQYVTEVQVSVTDRCNFQCTHCLLGDAKQIDLTPKDLDFLLNKADNPLFNTIVLFGGEPRMHPQFSEITGVVKDYVNRNGLRLATVDSILDWEQEFKNYRNKTEKILHDRCKPGEWRKLDESRELEGMLWRHYRDSDLNRKGKLFYAEMFTNGFGMTSPEKAVDIINNLSKQGISKLAISVDRAHRFYTMQSGRLLDYQFIDSLFTEGRDDAEARVAWRQQNGISGYMNIQAGSTDRYVIPVGRAANMTWDERIMLGDDFDPDLGEIGTLKKVIFKELNNEYDNWSKINKYSHCYCSPAQLFRKSRKMIGYNKENRIHIWGPSIKTDLSVDVCGLGMPSVGNLKEMSFEEIYQKSVTNRLFEILACYGPQGLARRLTCESDEELRAWFLERTPCGMCEDLRQSHSQEIIELLNTPSHN